MGKRAFGSVRRLKSGRYQVRYTGPDLAEHRALVTFVSKALAERWLANEDRALSNGTWVPPIRRAELAAAAEALGGLTVGEYVERVIIRRATRSRRPLAQTTTQGLTSMLGRFNLPMASDQTDESLEFYRAAALALGYTRDDLQMDISEKPYMENLRRSSLNNNCLHGIACPQCGSEDEFKIVATAAFNFTDDGTDGFEAVEYDDDASITCRNCTASGTVAEFRVTATTVEGGREN